MSISEPQQSGFLPRVESMRGLAALVVATFHVGLPLIASTDAGGVFDRLTFRTYMAINNGYGAVIAFFVMSGFVLARSLEANPDPIRFIRHRIFRLFPAAIFAVGLFTAWFYWLGINVYNGSYTSANVALNMLMIQTDINRVMWSIQVEFIAAPLILLSVWFYRRGGEKPLLIITVILFGLSFVGQIAHALGGDVSNLGPLYAFVVGILVHYRGRRAATMIKEAWAPFAAALCVFVFCLGGYLKPSGTWPSLLECLSAAALLALVVYHPKSTVFAPLDSWGARFYGRISYSFYLLHPLTLPVINPLVHRITSAAPQIPAFAVITVASAASIILISPLAYVSWRFIERPGIHIGNSLRRLSAIPLSVRRIG